MECNNRIKNFNMGIKFLRRLFYAVFFSVIIFQSLFIVLITGSFPDSLLEIKWSIFEKKCFEGYPYFRPYSSVDKEQQHRDSYVANVKESIIGNWILLYGIFMIYQVFFWIKYLVKYRYYVIVIKRRLNKIEHWNTDKLYTIAEKREVVKVLWKKSLVLNTFVNKEVNGDLRIILQLKMPRFVGIEVKCADGIVFCTNGSKRPLDEEVRSIYSNV